MDFVDTTSGQAVNSPFEYELWSVANPTSLQPSTRIYSLEQDWGYKHRDVHPGEEKFVLRDGTTYILKRRGHKPVHFKVPVRVSQVDAHMNVPEMDRVEFPATINV